MITKRIENAINIFLDAINNGTLAAGTCTACAVGNLVANANGETAYIPSREEYSAFKLKPYNAYWKLITPSKNIGVASGFTVEEAKKSIENVDFTIEELIIIEEAFEKACQFSWQDYNCDYLKLNPKQIRQDQINGLNAVVKVMMKFDDVKEITVEEVFTNKAELIPLN